MTLDDTDRRLIAALSRDARQPVSRLAEGLGLARTTVQTRLDRLERSGAIAGYTLRLAPEVARGGIRATALVNVAPRGTAAVLARLKALGEVETVHTTAGRFDLLVVLRAETPAALDRIIDRMGEIEHVQDIESLIHLSTRIDRGAG
ncbi:MAG: Lrp/AsnC family transcriptional regulator [Shimia sp.]